MIKAFSPDHLPESDPVLSVLRSNREIFWPGRVRPVSQVLPTLDISLRDVKEASDRLKRFAPFLASHFPETAKYKGLIESPLIPIPEMQKILTAELSALNISKSFPGTLLLKGDHGLPISGSIKARGGFYEVLKHAEDLAIHDGLIPAESAKGTEGKGYNDFDSNRFRKHFSQYSLAVGSTGNLGLSIGIMGAALGFNTTVHMSSDAREWKKERLRAIGVRVVEYKDDYGKAVEMGRQEAKDNPGCHFVDDENSRDLFMGYAVAAERLKGQLLQQNISINKDHPLYVYLPCGVGGGPGGVAFGLKTIFGDNCHGYFAEPTGSPCMLLGLYTGLHEKISVYDIGLKNRTAADGLAVARPSGFVGKRLEHLMAGCFTVSDDNLYRPLSQLSRREGITLEPSALAGMPGPVRLAQYLWSQGRELPQGAIHIVWATGGSMVPEKEKDEYIRRGEDLWEPSI